MKKLGQVRWAQKNGAPPLLLHTEDLQAKAASARFGRDLKAAHISARLRSST